MPLGSALVAACLMLGQIEAAPAVESQVSALIKQLDAPAKAEREAAERALLELGPQALEVLPPTSAKLPAETAMRLDRVRATLEKQAAAAAVRASTVTLKAQKMPLADVLAEIEKQTGNRLVDYREHFGDPGPEIALTFDVQQLPFWSLLDLVLQQGQLQVYPHAGADGLALVRGTEPSGLRRHRAEIESFRIQAQSFDARRELNNGQGNLTLNLSLSWEPRLRPIVLIEHLDAIHAVDDHDREIPLSQPGGKLEMPLGKDLYAVQLPLHFELPARDAQMMKSLRGKLAVVLPGAIESFRFDDLSAKHVEKKSAGATVVFDELRQNNDLWEARLTVAFEQAGPALESHQTWIFNNDVWIETPNKEKIEVAGYQTTHQSPHQIGIGYFFDLPDGPKGHTLVYRTPTSIQSVPIDFQLRDLELP